MNLPRAEDEANEVENDEEEDGQVEEDEQTEGDGVVHKAGDFADHRVERRFFRGIEELAETGGDSEDNGEAPSKDGEEKELP